MLNKDPPCTVQMMVHCAPHSRTHQLFLLNLTRKYSTSYWLTSDPLCYLDAPGLWAAISDPWGPASLPSRPSSYVGRSRPWILQEKRHYWDCTKNRDKKKFISLVRSRYLCPRVEIRLKQLHWVLFIVVFAFGTFQQCGGVFRLFTLGFWKVEACQISIIYLAETKSIRWYTKSNS